SGSKPPEQPSNSAIVKQSCTSAKSRSPSVQSAASRARFHPSAGPSKSVSLRRLIGQKIVDLNASTQLYRAWGRADEAARGKNAEAHRRSQRGLRLLVRQRLSQPNPRDGV